jgi:hypothetical protein
VPGKRNTTIWLNEGTGGILKANCDSVMACGAASTGLPEMMRPNIFVLVVEKIRKYWLGFLY